MNNKNTKKKIILGIFDSGVGGFSVVRKIREINSIDIIYFGDCAHAPYGNREEQEIVSFIRKSILFLQSKGVTHYVSACNSMSVLTTDALLQELHLSRETYLDMIDAVRLISFPERSFVFIIGTQATISSCVYQSIFDSSNVSHTSYVPKELAGFIEAGDEMGVRDIVTKIIIQAQKNNATHIFYACTHYPLVDDLFKEIATACSYQVVFVDPAVPLAETIQKLDVVGNNKTTFYTSKETKVFRDYCKGL